VAVADASGTEAPRGSRMIVVFKGGPETWKEEKLYLSKLMRFCWQGTWYYSPKYEKPEGAKLISAAPLKVIKQAMDQANRVFFWHYKKSAAS
jgi:hypothetical protein